MPELAEVEYYRKQWNIGVGDSVLRIQAHSSKRVFRQTAVARLRTLFPGAVLEHSEALGKQMLFRFSRELWLGIHLGMTGKLTVNSPEFRPGPHDHLVLYQAERALVFSDPRLFGRIRLHAGPNAPEWWSKLPPAVNSPRFTRKVMDGFLSRRRKLPVKSALLLQSGFPGIGNWMADEILWRAKIHPLTPAGMLDAAERGALWRSLRFVCRGALRKVGHDFSDPPSNWLFHERWNGSGRCPADRTPLLRCPVGGRTTVWCPACQPASPQRDEPPAVPG